MLENIFINFIFYYYLNKFNLFFSEKMEFWVDSASPDDKTSKWSWFCLKKIYGVFSGCSFSWREGFKMKTISLKKKYGALSGCSSSWREEFKMKNISLKKRMRIVLWEKVLRYIKAIDENFPFSWDEIMRKFSNFMVTYKRIKKKKKWNIRKVGIKSMKCMELEPIWIVPENMLGSLLGVVTIRYEYYWFFSYTSSSLYCFVHYFTNDNYAFFSLLIFIHFCTTFKIIFKRFFK